ncbi:MAG TPA: C-GCAxxG-C-C family protein, partial [Anaerolineales bacterium]|nr:C-GCAxxG-C-C family protein [Anaerolineales bacterium]
LSLSATGIAAAEGPEKSHLHRHGGIPQKSRVLSSSSSPMEKTVLCGGVTGALVALGLYFGSEDLLDYEATGATIRAARAFMPRFQERVGSVLCPDLHRDVVFGRYMDPAASPENMQAFAEAKGFEKCGLLPGIGARLAAEIILESIEQGSQGWRGSTAPGRPS